MSNNNSTTSQTSHSSGTTITDTADIVRRPPLPRHDDLKPIDAEELRSRLEIAQIHQRAEDAFAAMVAEEEDGGLEEEASASPVTANPNASSSQQQQRGGYRQMLAERSENPSSQVIASGDCSPKSEGVKRSERRDVSHFPDNRRENMGKK